MGRSRRGWKEEVDGENGEEGGSGQQIAHLEAGGGEGDWRRRLEMRSEKGERGKKGELL